MEAIGGLVTVLQGSGPAGALLAGAIVGLALAVILVAHFGGLRSDLRDRAQTVDFQAKLLATIDKLQASEDALRRRVDELGLVKTSQREELDELHVQLALLRNQRRRLIEMLRHAVSRLPEPPVRATEARA